MRRIHFLLSSIFALFLFASPVRAQNFLGGNNTAFQPQISIVESGAKLDVQATVSADRKYVTMTLRPQVAQLLALRDFVFQGPGGFVGGGSANNANPGKNPSSSPRAGPMLPASARPAEPVSVLFREGMTRVDRIP